MTHEPECQSFDGGHICICDVIRSAYQRGYLEGREDAAWDVTKVYCLRDTDLCDITEAIAAARGDGERA